MDKKFTRQLKEIKRIWIQGLREEKENWNRKSEEKAKHQTGQTEKKAKNQSGQSEKKARNQRRQSVEKAEKQTGKSAKISRKEFYEDLIFKTMYNNGIYKIMLLLAVVLNFPLVITSEVCTETVTKVSECPNNANEYEKRATEICTKACGNSMGINKYKYHCMLDSTRKYLIEMCAIPEYLFDFCPAYDRRGKQIQKDESRPCNTSSSRTYYNSTELFFCDLTNCLDSFVSSPSEKPEMTTTQMPDGESWYLHLIWVAIVPIVLIIGLIFLLRKRKKRKESSDCHQNPTREENGGSNGPLLAENV